MKGSYKKYKKFSKLLLKINLGHNSHKRDNRTLDKKEIKKNLIQNSFFNLEQPEIEYVSKLDLYSPETVNKNNLLQSIKTLPNDNKQSVNTSPEKKISNYNEGQKLQSNGEKFANQLKENKLENKRRELEIKISKIKGILKTLNEDLSKILSEIDNLKLDFDVLNNNKTNLLIEKNFKKQVITSELLDKKNFKNRYNKFFTYFIQ